MRTWPALEVGQLPPIPDLVQAALVDYRIAAIAETTSDLWQVFFSTSAERDRAAEDLPRQFPALSIRSVDVPDEDWVATSQASLRAVRVGDIVVAPPWDVRHASELAPDLAATRDGAQITRPVVIVIRPSMGFGTAHHATTRLCLAALQRLDVHGRSVLDVGTGSAVLAIAASQLGAALVVGVDDDPDALHAAEDNLSLNRAADVTLRAADLRSTGPLDSAHGGPNAFDLVMANLTGGLLTAAARRLSDLAAPGGRLILSGFLGDEETAVMAAYSNLTVTNRSEEEGWLCVTLQQP